jgi:RNA polymerase sigma factor (sigma-70 family)
MFPTTIWTNIGHAAADDPVALDRFARRYRPAVLGYIRGRGFAPAAAEDLCQEVFLRVLRGGVLAKARPDRGRFRSLILAVTTHVILDDRRKRRETPRAEIDEAAETEAFDHDWALHLAERALEQLRAEGSPYYAVLADHLTGRPQPRNKLWIARQKLAAHIRHEVAMTCASREDYEAELTYLARYLQPAAGTKSPKKV